MARATPKPECEPADHRTGPRHLPVGPDALERAALIFRALSEVPRLRLLALLSQGPSCVSELAAAEGEDLSTISQRLRVLRAERLVKRQRQGKHINYSLADQHSLGFVFNALAHASEAPATVVAGVAKDPAVFRKGKVR
jgi:ArsR family transcriptional regulator, lead/cadmium/zinc/bismuth-responsive transcriptional repressor